MTTSSINRPSVVTVLEDPAGRTVPLLSSWRVLDRLEIGRWAENKAIACSSAVLREGDFVDVGISFDIFVLPLRRRAYHSNAKHLVRAHLNIEHVLQLCPVEAASEVSQCLHHMLQATYDLLHCQFVRKVTPTPTSFTLPPVQFGKTALTF